MSDEPKSLHGKEAGTSGEPSLWSLLSGAHAQELEAERQIAEAAAARPTDTVSWSFKAIPSDDATKHIFVCGPSGSGKTTLIQLLLQTIVPRLRRPGANEQVIILDPKEEVLKLLSGMGVKPEDDLISILNPFDARSAVWSLSEATTSPALARYFATLFVPKEDHSTAPYFADSAREIVLATMNALNVRAKGAWSLRDLLSALAKPEHIREICRYHQCSDAKVETLFKDGRHIFGVLGTMNSKISHFETVAALWHTNQSRKKFSIDSFFAKSGIAVLGFNDIYKDSMAPIINTILKAICDRVLQGENSSKVKHWFILDEFAALGKAEFINSVLNRGRSKGASVVLGIQGIEQLIKNYEETGAEEILGNCAHKTFLRAGSVKTAEWAERYFGKVRSWESSHSQNWGGQGPPSGSSQTSTQDRPLFHSSFFTGLPYPKAGGDFVMVSDMPSESEVLIVRRKFDNVLKQLVPPGPEKGIIRRDDPESQTMKPWSEAEVEKFCGPVREKVVQATTKPSKALRSEGAKQKSEGAKQKSEGAKLKFEDAKLPDRSVVTKRSAEDGFYETTQPQP